ncbi:MAG: hypothetical protein ABII27_03180 [bacterium]
MFEAIEQAFPPQWQIPIKLLLTPISWIPKVQSALINFSLFSSNSVLAVFIWIFIFLPCLLFIVGAWCSMLGIYTYPFRRSRNLFVVTLFITWWDSIRSVWLFWVGAFRFVWLAFGWFLGAIKITIGVIFEAMRQIFYYPFLLFSNMGRQYFRAGIPWIAVMLTVLWIFLEATIFTYVLAPTMTEVISGLTGAEVHSLLVPILFLFLLFLIGGSFACLLNLGEAIKKKNILAIIQMSIWELFVVLVEVLFLYRDLVDALAPWFAQQTNEQIQLGLVGTISIAFFAWVGIRAMTWFLFAKYGTSTLIAIIARKPIKEDGEFDSKPIEVPLSWTKTLIGDFKSEINWFHNAGKEFLEALALPALQVMASAINFCMVFISSKPIFSLPFKHIEEVMETKELVKMFENQRKKSKEEDE